jgi:hypothetical protein
MSPACAGMVPIPVDKVTHWRGLFNPGLNKSGVTTRRKQVLAQKIAVKAQECPRLAWAGYV